MLSVLDNVRGGAALAAASVLLLLGATGSARAGAVATALERALASAGPDEPIPVVILMEEFPAPRGLLAEVRGLGRQARRSLVTQRMRSRAATTQRPVRSLLGKSRIDLTKARVLWGINGLALEVPAHLVTRIAALPEVRWVLHDPEIPLERMLDGPTGGDESGPNPAATVAGELTAMGAEQVWNDLGFTGAGAIVAVIDTGVDRTHLDLADHIWTNLGEIAGNAVDDDGNGLIDDTWGWDFCNDDNDPTGTDSHGTQVAGQVAGDGTRGTVTGMAPDAELMALRVCQVSTWWAASDYAIAQGAHIITQSLSLKWPDQPNYEAFRRQAATELAAGLIHANSTGNTGDELGSHPVPYNVSAPGNCPPPWLHPDQTLIGGLSSIIGSANIDYWTEDVAASSPYGPSAWEEIRAVTDPDYPYFMPPEFQDYAHDNGSSTGLLKPDIAAYGTHTTTVCTDTPSGYCAFSGTSSATPHIAGALALMLSAEPGATPEDLARALLTTASPYTTHKSNRYGVGLLQVYPAVQALLSPCPAPEASVVISMSAPRVGDTVLFDSTVSGGAGGPYGYRWDFDADGVIDSTAEDPAYIYHRPYDGPVTLWVEDAAGCGATERGQSISVSGPDLRFDGITGLTEIAGNGDAGIDPGETWELRVDLRNDGNETAVGVAADLTPYAPAPGQVSILQGSSAYPDIPAGAVRTSSAAYRFRVGDGYPCGADIALTLSGITSVVPANTYPDQIGPVLPVVEFENPTLYFDGLETGGWALNGEWQLGAPMGLGGPGADPPAAYEGQNVLGTDLTGLGALPGNYENDVNVPTLSPVIDIPPGITDVSIGWAQWLNVRPGDTVSALVWSSATGWWTTFYSATDVADTAWNTPGFDVSPFVAGADHIRVQFKIVTDGQDTDSGWNIDNLEVTGHPAQGCEPHGPYPRHDGVTALVEVDGNGDGAVDPGETWEFTERLRNIGAQTATGVAAGIVVDPSTPAPVTILQGLSTYPDIDAAQVQASDSAYRFRVPDGFPCGEVIRLSVTDISTTPPPETYPDDAAAIAIPVAEDCNPVGAYPRYDGISDLTEIEGNGDSAVDPGEIWDLTVHLRNDGGAPALGVTANLDVTPEAAGKVFVLQGGSGYPDIGPGQVVASNAAYRIRLATGYACGNDVPLSVTDISAVSGTWPDEVGAIGVTTSAAFPVVAYSEDFETNAGWAVNGEWHLGAPLGLGSPDPDPSGAYTGQKVLGYDLSGTGDSPGNYENDIDDPVLSPPIDIPPGGNEVRLEFARWLNVLPGDQATVRVWQNATFTWTTVYSASDVTETAWSPVSIDVTQLMQGADRMSVQFRMTSDGQATNSGWNIDALEVHAEACELFERDSAGEVTGLMVSEGGPGQIVLNWNVDCGGGTTYGVYRGDLRAGYASIAPVPGRCDVAGTSVTLPEGAGDADFFIVVPHENSMAGGYGGGAAGAPRPEPPGACYPQGPIYACSP